MAKTSWARVFLGGLLAGVVLNILMFAASALYLDNLFNPALLALNPNYQMTMGIHIFWVVLNLASGILAVWLYSAIRPRYGGGAKTALLAGVMYWVIGPLSLDVILGSMGLFPGGTLAADALTTLVVFVVATYVGAWVYRNSPR